VSATCLLCIISVGELGGEEAMKEHFVVGEVELMNGQNRAVCEIREFWIDGR
jgi:hypothetical protein